MRQFITLFSVILCLFAFNAKHSYAQGYYSNQENSDSPPSKRWILGGGLGVQFGTVTVLQVNPKIGYALTNRLVVGTNLSYNYYRDTYYKETYETNIFGASLFGQYYVYGDIFAQAEYGVFTYDKLVQILPNKKENVVVPQFLLGGGYTQRLGGHTGVFISILFDVINNEDSPYANPQINVGFQFGL